MIVQRYGTLCTKRPSTRTQTRHYNCCQRDRKFLAVIPIIIGALALGAIGRGFKKLTRKIQMENYCDLMQKACLLGAAQIIRKILDSEDCVLHLAHKKYQPP